MQRKRLSVLFTLLLISLMAYFVWAGLDSIAPVSPLGNRTLMSGAVNLSANTTGANANTIYVNFSFINGGQVQYVANVTNNTVNQVTPFSFTFDTLGNLSDGIYNITINATNSTGSVYNTTVFNVTIDNTPPQVTNVARSVSGIYSISTNNVTFNSTVIDITTGVSQVIFYFNNASNPAGGFNVSAVNNSGIWNFSFNVSKLRGGFHTVTVIANDTVNNSITKPASNYNRTETITFTVNTPPNVTKISVNQGQNFSISSGVQVFNISVVNRTTFSKVTHVFFQFDNASSPNGAFNVTTATNSLNKSYARYWNFSYNVSKLRGGVHTVTIFANDTSANFNRTETFTFNVNTAPNVTIISPSAGVKYDSGERIFNVSAVNSTTSLSKVTHVIFQFDNSTGNAFNVTATNSLNKSYARYWNVSVDVSTLVEGSHIVTVFANDTTSNFNRTQTLSFTIDRTAPTISLTKSSDSTSTKLVITVTTSSDAQTCTSNRGSVSGSGTSQTITASSLNPDTTYSFEVTCTDDSSPVNSHKVTQSFKTDGVNGGGSAGGSSGGGGGGSSSSSSSTADSSSDDGSSASNSGAGGGSTDGSTSGQQGTAQGTQVATGSGDSATEAGRALAGQAVSNKFAGGRSAVFLWIILAVIVIIAGAAYYFTRKKN